MFSIHLSYIGIVVFTPLAAGFFYAAMGAVVVNYDQAIFPCFTFDPVLTVINRPYNCKKKKLL